MLVAVFPNVNRWNLETHPRRADEVTSGYSYRVNLFRDIGGRTGLAQKKENSQGRRKPVYGQIKANTNSSTNITLSPTRTRQIAPGLVCLRSLIRAQLCCLTEVRSCRKAVYTAFACVSTSIFHATLIALGNNVPQNVTVLYIADLLCNESVYYSSRLIETRDVAS